MLANNINFKSSETNRFQPSVFFVILNWNNASDTIECLESLRSLNYENFVIILIDNGSTDDSLQQISSWSIGRETILQSHIREEQHNGKQIKFTELSAEDVAGFMPVDVKTTDFNVVLIKSPENLGFAKGSNLGIRFALKQKADYTMLLNNDTVIDPMSLEVLVAFLESNNKYSLATPQIRYYSDRDKVSHCGGRLVWFGARKYFFYDANASTLPKKEFTEITLFSGCAVLFRSDLFVKVGLLSEQFFHGEEDFEFSWRLKKKKIYAACCFRSVIYHKIGSTVNKAFAKNILGKILNYYLNRYIDMRNYFYRPFWSLWRVLYLFYIIPMLMFRYSFSLKTMIMFSKQLLFLSKKLNGVDKNLFEQLTKNQFPVVVK